MTSRYSIIQYAPNPIADERINIGVIVFDDETVHVNFLHHWDRVRCFGKTDISFLLDFAQRMKESAKSGLLFPGDIPSEIPRHESLTKLALGCMNCIQFTEPRASLEDVNHLMDDIVSSFLVDELPKKTTVRDRTAARKLTTSKIRKVLKKRIGDKANDYLKESLKGSEGTHNFDVVVANGSPYLAAHGISFEVQVHQNLLDSLYWRIRDIKDLVPDFPVAIVSLPPKDGSKDPFYKNTTEIFTKLGAQVIEEEGIERWANQTLMHTNI